jgi:predicted house-cleaning NTP pyrophosphatase (Maf/HAM1 superfamily)
MVSTLVLASNSPRRRQLLAFTGWRFLVRPVDIDERPQPGELPEEYVLRLAESKARAAGRQAEPGQIVLAADTTVANGDTILGKPADAREAQEMLRSLRRREHIVYTAIGVCQVGTLDDRGTSIDQSAQPPGTEPLRAGTPRVFTDVCATRVWMRNYSDEEIEAYIASGDPFDKAGAYAIQNPDFQPVERIEGCYSCVAGLPVCQVVRALARFGLTPPEDVTAACSTHLEMDTPCPVYEALLRIESGGSQSRGKEK